MNTIINICRTHRTFCAPYWYGKDNREGVEISLCIPEEGVINDLKNAISGNRDFRLYDDGSNYYTLLVFGESAKYWQ